ncbi:unnamed protein product [Hydatigera taeniaeformis]|uniref:Secreted protein n=1 Tax=Hydatigena taeniaeformis TaxID=6205 RepID=A0A0R3XBL8_HYDTA|nr:unnamed protein product [Hydatigera taeniaeformis]
MCILDEQLLVKLLVLVAVPLLFASSSSSSSTFIPPLDGALQVFFVQYVILAKIALTPSTKRKEKASKKHAGFLPLQIGEISGSKIWVRCASLSTCRRLHGTEFRQPFYSSGARRKLDAITGGTGRVIDENGEPFKEHILLKGVAVLVLISPSTSDAPDNCAPLAVTIAGSQVARAWQLDESFVAPL